MTFLPGHALVLGANGSLGSAIMFNLRMNPAYRSVYPKVTFVSRRMPKFKFENVTSPPQDVTYLTLDFSNSSEVHRELPKLIIPNTVVFYCAFCFVLPLDTLVENNITLLDNVLASLASSDISAIVLQGYGYDGNDSDSNSLPFRLSQLCMSTLRSNDSHSS
jgi:nucleoside-diphosphate-sugar epimerase